MSSLTVNIARAVAVVGFTAAAFNSSAVAAWVTRAPTRLLAWLHSPDHPVIQGALVSAARWALPDTSASLSSRRPTMPGSWPASPQPTAGSSSSSSSSTTATGALDALAARSERELDRDLRRAERVSEVNARQSRNMLAPPSKDDALDPGGTSTPCPQGGRRKRKKKEVSWGPPTYHPISPRKRRRRDA